MSTMSTCGGCGEAFDLALPHECNRETRLQRALNSEMADNDRLRAALAAAEAKLADEKVLYADATNAWGERVAAADKLAAALAQERKHVSGVVVDSLYPALRAAISADLDMVESHIRDAINKCELHTARRAAEVANG